MDVCKRAAMKISRDSVYTSRKFKLKVFNFWSLKAAVLVPAVTAEAREANTLAADKMNRLHSAAVKTIRIAIKATASMTIHSQMMESRLTSLMTTCHFNG